MSPLTGSGEVPSQSQRAILREFEYLPYKGPRSPSWVKAWVILRAAFLRDTANWLVRIALVASAFYPLLGAIVLVALRGLVGHLPNFVDEGRLSRHVLHFVLDANVIFAFLVTLGSGAMAIADDMSHRAFVLYFSKPLAPIHYMIGRVGALFLLIFGFSVAAGGFVLMVDVATSPPHARLEEVLLFFHVVFHSLLLAFVFSSSSIAISSLSSSRALGVVTWLIVWIVPLLAVALADSYSGGSFPWFRLFSLFFLFDAVTSGLLGLGAEARVSWFFALVVLIFLGGLCFHLTHLRVASMVRRLK
ncbi:MAG: hypothetical protein RMJ84_08405 [Sandaracinaceae bacterium]|nr:hypothetical protein [Sandaracinaceae bacterium]